MKRFLLLFSSFLVFIFPLTASAEWVFANSNNIGVVFPDDSKTTYLNSAYANMAEHNSWNNEIGDWKVQDNFIFTTSYSVSRQLLCPVRTR